jgi:hypothetical protein
MAIILSSSGSAPMSSVMMCWNIVANNVNMSFREELFALGAWTDWLGTCWFCLKGGRHSFLSLWRCRPANLRLLHSRRHGLVWLEEYTLPVVVLGSLYDFLFRISSMACLQSRQLVQWGYPPSTNLQLQHVRIDTVLSFSGHSFCRWPPSHHIQQGGCLQLAHCRIVCSCDTAWDQSRIYTPLPW